MQKIYIDSRFRTANSKSESDFNVELPRSFNVPDGVVAHIDDIVIPVSWSTIDERNNTAYVAFYILNTMHDVVITFDSKNYDGATFAYDLQQKLTAAVVGFAHNGIPVVPTFSCTYDVLENILTVGLTEGPNAAFVGFKLEFYTDEKLRTKFKYSTKRNVVSICVYSEYYHEEIKNLPNYHHAENTGVNAEKEFNCCVILINLVSLHFNPQCHCATRKVTQKEKDNHFKICIQLALSIKMANAES